MNNRFKNPYFWIGLIGVVLTALGLKPEQVTSWSMLANSLINAIQNPYLLVSVIMAVLGVFVDPTSKGLKDE